jgi:hypothetical protein
LKSKIILHIGLERTGTTSLQQFCVDRRRDLRKTSILYPMKSIAFARINHAPLAGCYFSGDPEDFTVAAPPGRKSAVLASLFDEIDASGAEVALISSEHLSSRLNGPKIMELAADFAARDCRIAVTVRDHLPRFFSAYSNHVISGGVTTLETYADHALAPKRLDTRYAETISLWEKAFGQENIRVFAYDRRQDMLRTILDGTTGKKFEVPPASSYHENRSYGPIVTEAFRRANAMAEEESWSHTMGKWERRRLVRVLMQIWLATSSSINLSAGQWTLDEGRLAQLKAIAASDREWLDKRYGVDLMEEPAKSSTGHAPDERWLQTFHRRAIACWRLLGPIEPAFALAPQVSGALRVMRDKLKI